MYIIDIKIPVTRSSSVSFSKTHWINNSLSLSVTLLLASFPHFTFKALNFLILSLFQRKKNMTLLWCWKDMSLILINFIYCKLVEEFSPSLNTGSARFPACNLLQLSSKSLKIKISNGNTGRPFSCSIIRRVFSSTYYMLLHNRSTPECAWKTNSPF